MNDAEQLQQPSPLPPEPQTNPPHYILEAEDSISEVSESPLEETKANREPNGLISEQSPPEANEPLPEANKPIPEANKSSLEMNKAIPEATKAIPEATKVNKSPEEETKANDSQTQSTLSVPKGKPTLSSSNSYTFFPTTNTLLASPRESPHTSPPPCTRSARKPKPRRLGDFSKTLPTPPKPPPDSVAQECPSQFSGPSPREESPRNQEEEISLEEEPPKSTRALKRKTVRLDDNSFVSATSFFEVSNHERKTYIFPKLELGSEEQSAAVKERHRQFAIQELLSTEQDYVLDLATLVTRMVLPLRKTKLLTLEEFGTLFSNVEMLSQCMQGLLRDLKEADALHELEQSVGKVFLGHTDTLLQCYTTYCGNYDESTTLLVKLLKKKTEFRRWHQKVTRDPMCKKQDLSVFTVKPVQRLCRYPLLLQEIMKNTNESHPDFLNLKLAIEHVEKTVRRVNDNSASKTNLKNLQRIQKLLTGDRVQLLVPGRKFHLEGAMKRVRNTGKPLDRHSFLFNDLLLCTEPTGKKYKVKNFFLLSEIDVVVAYDQRTYKHGFVVQNFTKSTKTIFLCPSENSLKEWFSTIQSILHTDPNPSRKSIAAYSITSPEIGRKENQMKLLSVMEQVEGFGAKMGANFQQKCFGELEVQGTFDQQERTLFLFEDVIVITKSRKLSKKPLVFEMKVEISALDMFLSKSRDLEGQETSGDVDNFQEEMIGFQANQRRGKKGGSGFGTLMKRKGSLIPMKKGSAISFSTSRRQQKSPDPISGSTSFPNPKPLTPPPDIKSQKIIIRTPDWSLICDVDPEEAALFLECFQIQKERGTLVGLGKSPIKPIGFGGGETLKKKKTDSFWSLKP